MAGRKKKWVFGRGIWKIVHTSGKILATSLHGSSENRSGSFLRSVLFWAPYRLNVHAFSIKAKESLQ